MAKNDPKMFLQIHKPPVFIDEVQYAPELFTYIKIHIDQKHLAGGFWMTGSQIFKLMDGVQESLAERVCLLHMSPMSQAEICGVEAEPFELNFDKLVKRTKERKALDTPAIYQRIFNGGMPALKAAEGFKLIDSTGYKILSPSTQFAIALLNAETGSFPDTFYLRAFQVSMLRTALFPAS